MKIRLLSSTRSFIVLVVLLFLCIVFTPHFLYAEDKIVAVVNQEVITQKDLLDFLSFMRMQLSREYKGKELEEKLNSMKRDILMRLIEDRLILQEAKKNNVNIEDSRVRQRIEQVKKEYPSDAVFQVELMKQGVTQGDIEKKIKEQFMTFSIIEQKIRSKIIVKPEEITEFYNKNRKDFDTGDGKEFQAISLENESLAKAVSYGLKTKIKIEELASRYPLTLNKLMVYKGDELRKEILDVVSKMSIGEVSEPVKIGDKYYVFSLVNIIPAKSLSLFESQDKIKALLFDKKMQDSLSSWLADLKSNSYIKIMND